MRENYDHLHRKLSKKEGKEINRLEAREKGIILSKTSACLFRNGERITYFEFPNSIGNHHKNTFVFPQKV